MPARIHRSTDKKDIKSTESDEQIARTKQDTEKDTGRILEQIGLSVVHTSGKIFHWHIGCL